MNSVEAELLSTVKYVKETMDGHIKSDEIMFKELINKLHSIDTSVSNLIVFNTETLKNQIALQSINQDMVNKHNKFLFGDGEMNNGVSTRLDRLEGESAVLKWTVRGFAIGVMGLIFDRVKQFLNTGH